MRGWIALVALVAAGIRAETTGNPVPDSTGAAATSASALALPAATDSGRTASAAGGPVAPREEPPAPVAADSSPRTTPEVRTVRRAVTTDSVTPPVARLQPEPRIPAASDTEAGRFGVGLRVLGEKSQVILRANIRPLLGVELRGGWNRSRSSGDPSPAVSYYQLQDQYTTSGRDTATTQQAYAGVSRRRSETVEANLEALLVADIPAGRGVDLVVGAGPTWSYDRTSQSNTVVGTTPDSVPTSSSTSNSSRSQGWGAAGLLGFRWWVVPGRLALAGEMSTSMEWATTRSRIRDQSTVVTTYIVPSSFGWPDHRVVENRHETPSSSDDFRWTSASCALGLDVFF